MSAGMLLVDWSDRGARSPDLVVESHWIKARTSATFATIDRIVFNPEAQPCAVFLTAAGLLIADPARPIRFGEPARPASYEQLALL